MEIDHNIFLSIFSNSGKGFADQEFQWNVGGNPKEANTKQKINRVNSLESNQFFKNSKLQFVFRKFDTVRGRYITTIEKIHVDEPIFEEKAFAFVPVYNNYESNQISKHCENCAKTNVIPFPCYQCGRASYCSPRCQRVHNVIHNHECPGYEDNLWKRIGIAHLALRSLVVGFETVIKGTKFEERTTPLEFWNELMERSETDENFKYGQVLRLGTNFNKMDSADLLRYALVCSSF